MFSTPEEIANAEPKDMDVLKFLAVAYRIKHGDVATPYDAAILRLNGPIYADSRPASGTVYVVKSGKFVKIGFSTNMKERLRDLQKGSATKLRVLASFPGTYSSERALHKRFRDHKSHAEWFRIEGALAEWIKEGCPL